MNRILPNATAGALALLLAVAVTGCAHNWGTPYRHYIFDNLAPGEGQNACPTSFFTVPAEQRLVIKYVSIWGVSRDVEAATVSLSSSGAQGKYMFFLERKGTNQIGHPLYGENQLTDFSFEPGETVSYCIARDKNADDYGYRIQLYGTLFPAR
jgi:hypothetical protein